MKQQLSQSDFYTKKARQENYPARSVYKLKEIDGHFQLVKKGDKVLDLGAAPGSWLMYLSKQVGESGLVIAVDIVDLAIFLPSNAKFFKQDILAAGINFTSLFTNLQPLQSIRPPGGRKFNVVLSDLAPQTSGIRSNDVASSLELCQKAWQIAQDVLIAGGHFVCKVFEGQGADNFVKQLKPYFQIVKKAKPQAIRKHSKEFYLVAIGYKE